MSDAPLSMPRRTLLQGLGLRLLAAPGWSLLSAHAGHGGSRHPVIAPVAGQKVLSVDAIEAAPDGVRRPVYAFAGQLIGPTIRVKEGERLNSRVINNLRVPTTVHWHGMHQPGTWRMDGVEGVSGPAIAPGESLPRAWVRWARWPVRPAPWGPAAPMANAASPPLDWIS